MHRILATSAAVLAAGLLGATSAQAGVILQPKSVTIDVGGELFGFSASNMIDQSGLSLKYVAGVTDFDTYVGLKPLHAVDRGEWLANGPATTAKITFDFGEVVEFRGFALWNEDASSLGSIIMSIPGGGSYGGTGNLQQNPVGVAYGPTVHNHQKITSRYVTFSLFGCNAAGAAHNGCGMGEVIFNSTQAAPPPGVPEPATWAMMIMGFAGVGAMIRRRQAFAAA